MCLFRVCCNVFKIRTSSIYTPPSSAGQWGACEGSNWLIKATARRPWGSWHWREGTREGISRVHRGEGLPSRLGKQIDFLMRKLLFSFCFSFERSYGNKDILDVGFFGERLDVFWCSNQILLLFLLPCCVPSQCLQSSPSCTQERDGVAGGGRGGAGVCGPGTPPPQELR